MKTVRRSSASVADGGVLSRKGVVDFSVGKGVAPGVFVIAEMDHPRLRERMNDLKLGEGPYYNLLPALSPHQPRGAADPARAPSSTARPTWCRSTGPSPRSVRSPSAI